ncbi:MAG: hypothetical protein OJJ54_18960 [Pseudonocardia sp.]|nr:hypothetical protein [Pseudonocardia sp.]
MSSVPGLAVLEPRRTIIVTQVEDHQDILADHAPVGSERREVLVELTFCTVSAGMYVGSRGIEVRLDGYRVGELTPTMSHRYAELLEQVYAAGQQPGAEAVLKHGTRGLELQLRLPALDESEEPTRLTPVVDPRASPLGDLPQQNHGPDHAFVPQQSGGDSWVQQEAALYEPGPYESGYDATYDDRPAAVPGGAVAPPPHRVGRAAGRRGPGKAVWIAGGAAAAVLIGVTVLFGSGGDEPASFSASTALPGRAAPTPSAPAPTTTSVAPTTTAEEEPATVTSTRPRVQLTLTVAPLPRTPAAPAPGTPTLPSTVVQLQPSTPAEPIPCPARQARPAGSTECAPTTPPAPCPAEGVTPAPGVTPVPRADDTCTD